MSETQPTTRPPATPEADLVKSINEAYAHIERATRETVPRAIDLGAMLIKAKADYGAHGKWGQWLKANCKQLSERTAQLYMNLAKGRSKIEAELSKRGDPATVADLIAELSLRGALRLLEAESVETKSVSGTSKGNAGKSNPSDDYDNVQEKLIEKLKKLKPDEAALAAYETINVLKKTVSEMKQIAENATAKAA